LQKAATRIVVQPFGHIEDPEHSVDHFVHSECDLFVDALFSRTLSPSPKEWLTAWVEQEKKAREVVTDFLGLGEKGDHSLSEPALAASLFEWVDDDVTVVVSSSMPIRDVEWFAPPRSVAPRIISNRGANGIDGVVSTALGVALGTRKATVCLVGDLAFLHDVSALVKMRSSDLVAPLVIVVANNAGGGIFEFLPPSQQLERERFELLFGTPPSVDIAAVANGFGHRVREVATRGEFKEALNWGLSTPCLSVVVVQLPTREKNRQLHDELTKRFNAAF
jgi:2-succinyl-5-enolpyruvyl-6-hydroxy-3-cyclohexene-1-carboxylate synthase